MLQAATLTLALRPAGPADEPFLLDLYGSTRAEELALTGWDAPTQAAFIQMQFEAQSRFYASQYPAAGRCIIQMDGQDVGRLIVHRAAEEILLMDIALMPERRGRGAGTILIQELMAEAARTARPLRLHVEYFNRALPV